jgi:hypothetical protein
LKSEFDPKVESLPERVERVLAEQQRAEIKIVPTGSDATSRLLHCAKVRQEAAADPRLCKACGYFTCICDNPELFNLAADITRTFANGYRNGVL